MDFDLDLIMKKAHTIKIDGKKHEFKDLTVEESMIAEYEANEIENFKIKEKEDVKGLQERIGKWMVSVIDIPEELASQITLKGFKAIRKIQGRLDMYDQGFTDAEIDKMEKEAMKKSIFQPITERQ